MTLKLKNSPTLLASSNDGHKKFFWWSILKFK